MIGKKKRFGSLYDQSESADLDDLQLERTHIRSNFCVDTIGIFYIYLLFLIYIALVLTYSLITIRTPDKISRSISRVPVFISKKDQNPISSFNVDLKIINLHHSPNFINILNCSAAKTDFDDFPLEFSQGSANNNLQSYEKYQNVVCSNCLVTSFDEENKDIYFQFNITERHRLTNRNSTFEEYSNTTFKSVTAIFPKNSLYSSEFNIFSFIFNDHDYFSVEKDPDNYIYSEHSAVNSPSLISNLNIQTNYSNISALDFVYYYNNPIMKKYYKSSLQIFSTIVLFALSINIFYTKHQISKFTRVFCIILGILGVLATNPLENFIDSTVFNYLAPNHLFSIYMNQKESLNEASLRFGCFNFALFNNALRLFICFQFCFLCCHNFKIMFRAPNLFVTFGLFIFYLIFTLVDYKAQYYHEKNVLRYSSLSYANRDLLISEQSNNLQRISYDSTLYLPSSMASQNNLIPSLGIEKLRIFFVLIHFCFYIWLIKTALEKINDGADPHPNAESDRLKALIIFSIIPNIATILVHCFFVLYSIYQRKIFPEVLLFASNEFCVASILLLFRGVEDDIEDDSFQRFYKLGHHSDFDQRNFEIN